MFLSLFLFYPVAVSPVVVVVLIVIVLVVTLAIDVFQLLYFLIVTVDMHGPKERIPVLLNYFLDCGVAGHNRDNLYKIQNILVCKKPHRIQTQ